jgi:hypothetical protein
MFLKGLSLIEGFVLGCELLHLTPDRFAEEKELWAGFLRSAITKRAVGDATSALDTVWMRKDPYANGALTNWYFSLIAQVIGSPLTKCLRGKHPRGSCLRGTGLRGQHQHGTCPRGKRSPGSCLRGKRPRCLRGNGPRGY